jgi:ankyrin repeat protein
LYIPKSILKERLAESKIRALYQNERSSVLLKDHVQLVDLFKKREEMRNSLETPEEESMPKLLTRHRLPGPVIDSSSVRNAFGLAYDPLTQGNYCIVDFEQFKANFAALTLNVLAGLDLKNLCFFGDLVVGALLVNDGSSNNDQHITSAHFRDADIEIAILGLDGEAAAKKVRDIFFAVQSATKASCEIIRTQKEIIILGQYPVRNIRIPLRSFKGPAEVIFFQDVDVRCVGFDGNTVWALPRAQRALTKRYNLVDLALGHTTYEVNLYRWAKRGFAVAVPGFQRHLVTPHLLKQKPWQVRGLAKLLLLEVELNAQWAPPTPVGTALTFEPWTPKHQRFSVYSRDEFSLMRIHEFQALQKETYIEEKENIDAIDVDHHSVLFIPWGPQWRNSRVLKHLKFANSRFCESLVAMVGESGASEARPLVLFGLEAVLKGSVPSSVLDAAADIDEDWDDIDGSVRFHGDETSVTKDVLLERTVTSGAASFSTDTKAKRRQGSTGLRSSTASSNGSSNISSTVTPPNSEATTEEAWYYEAYCIKESAVEVTHAITDLAFAGLVSELSKLLRKLPRTYDVSHPSSYANGRTALNYAACNGSADAISALIAKGANPASVDSASGLSPIHFAAFSGNATAVEALLRHPSVDINAKTRDQRWTPLHFASYYGNTAALLVLLQDTKIRLNPRDKAGRSPVFVAAYAGHVKCLEMLKSAGAKMDTKAPPKTESGITALAIAAQNGHSEARSYLVELLKPAYPPLLQPSTESLAELEAGSSGSASGSSLLRSSLDSVTSRIANPREIAEWSMVDKFGQNMLHYAVKNGEVALVRQILSSALAQRSNGATSQVGDMDIAMPASISSFNLINIHAQNVYGQNALYYAQHLLDAFVGGKQLEEGDIPSTIEAIGIPTSVKTAACREIVGHLQRSGVKEAHLLPQRSLPDSQDDGMYQVMVRLARTARQIVKQADEARRQREAELEAEERSSRPLARTPIKRQRSNDSSSHSGPRLGLSPSSSSLAGAYSPHGRPHGGNGRPSLGLSASGRNHGIPGFVFSSSGAASPASFQDLASSNDTTQLLSTISQMHKTKQISDKDKIALKTLAMKQDRTLLSALRAFQHDHVSLAFGNTLRQIASYASSS